MQLFFLLIFGLLIFGQFSQILLRINQNPSYAKIFTQIQNSLKEGSPLEQASKVIAEFESTATREQANVENLKNRLNHQCDDQFAFRAKTVRESQHALVLGQRSLQGCKDNLIIVKNQLIFTKKSLEEASNFLSILDEIREADIQAFNVKQEAYNMLTAHIDQALDLLEKLVMEQASIAQLVSISFSMLRQSLKLSSSGAESIRPLIEVFTEELSGLASKATEIDKTFFERLQNVITGLRRQLEQEWEDTLDQEAQYQASYEFMRETSLDQVRNSEQNLLLLDNTLINLNQCIIDQSAVVERETNQRNVNQRLWDDAAAYCATMNKSYQESQEQQQEELEIISSLRLQVTQRWGDFQDVQKERINQELQIQNQNQQKT